MCPWKKGFTRDPETGGMLSLNFRVLSLAFTPRCPYAVLMFGAPTLNITWPFLTYLIEVSHTLQNTLAKMHCCIRIPCLACFSWQGTGIRDWGWEVILELKTDWPQFLHL